MLFKDSLTSRLTAAIVAAMITGAVLDLAVSRWVGRWAHPPLAQSGLIQTAAEVLRILEAAPPASREQLAARASGATFKVVWYPALPLPPATVSRLRELKSGDLGSSLTPDLSLTGRRTLVVRPQDTQRLDQRLRMGRRAYVLLVALRDGGWVGFCVFDRSWGVGSLARAPLAILLFALSATVMAVLFARLIARPLEAMNKDIQRLGMDRLAAPVAERGPVELRRTIGAVNAMRARIQAFIEARTLLLATISHDLRTPLTRMRLRSELMQDSPLAGAWSKDIDEMSVMVNSALSAFREDYADDEASTLIDLGALIQTIIDQYDDRAIVIPFRRLGIALAYGRPNALRRAVQNIIDNAVRHARAVEAEVSHVQGSLVIDILDRGPGLPQEALEQVFRPFFRHGDPTKHTVDGFGLGLASARSIALAHNGDVQAFNRNGGGLCVSLRLPAAEG